MRAVFNSPTRRAVLRGAAGSAAALLTGRGAAAARTALVYDATRFKAAPPRALADFGAVELYRGPRGLPLAQRVAEGEAIGFRDAAELADLMAGRFVAMALIDVRDVAALKADSRLLVGVATG
ncbi:hypothetical protein [Methylocella sp.]|uniref:hypothetical protein n=1 Tax=Methylocella sp. TaxID=1978226 RepID=UPI0035B4E593